MHGGISTQNQKGLEQHLTAPRYYRYGVSTEVFKKLTEQQVCAFVRMGVCVGVFVCLTPLTLPAMPSPTILLNGPSLRIPLTMLTMQTAVAANPFGREKKKQKKGKKEEKVLGPSHTDASSSKLRL
jgi:hypothetical protein